MSTGARLGILGAIIAAAIVVLVVVSGGSDDKSSTTTTTTTAVETTTSGTTTKTTTAAKPAAPPVPTIVVKNAKPVGGVKKIELNKGERVRFVVKSDTADEIHVHGYDFHKDVAAGGTVRFGFPATIDGNFEIELENHKEQIAELTVQP